MLRISKVSAERLDYYLEPSTADREGGAADGRYLGRIADSLGLSDQPVPSTLAILASGVDPLSGEVLSSSHRQVRVAAFDCTFAAPKSVSLLASLAPREVATQVVQAHRASTGAVLSYLERHGALVRRGTGEARRVVDSDGFAAAEFVHRTSRANDPHLHTHLVVLNLGVDQSGRYSALDARGLFEEAAAASALYRCSLRFVLSERLDLRFRNDRRGFNDLAGLSRRVVESFSGRAAEIAEELSRSGRNEPLAASFAAHRTRSEKDLRTPLGDLAKLWQQRAYRAGVAAGDLSRLSERPPNRLSSDAADVRTAEAARSAVAAFPGRFSRSELLQATCAALVGGAPVALVERQVAATLQSQEVVAVARAARRSGSDREMPLARLDTRFLSKEAAAAFDRDTRRLAEATPLEGRPLNLLRPGALYRCGGPDAFTELTELARSNRSGSDGAVGVAPSEGLAAHLESLTGVPSMAQVRSVADPPPQFGIRAKTLVVYGAERLAPIELDRLLVDATRRRSSVVLIDREASPRRPEDTLKSPPPLERVEGVRVCRVETPAAALGAMAAIRNGLRAAGKPVVSVSVDPLLVGDGGVAPHQLRRTLNAAPEAVALVLGSARLLGAGLGGIDDKRRIHVVVAPRENDQRADRGRLLELALPKSIARSIGLPPPEAEARSSWRREAQQFERQGLLAWPSRALQRNRPELARSIGR